MKFLESALKRNPLFSRTIDQVLSDDDCEIYTAYRDNEVMGAFCLEFLPDSMNIALFGAKDLKSWRNDALLFIQDMQRITSSKELYAIGRKGWDRLFPELLKPIGTVYGRVIE